MFWRSGWFGCPTVCCLITTLHSRVYGIRNVDFGTPSKISQRYRKWLGFPLYLFELVALIPCPLLCRFTLGSWLLVGSTATHVPSSFDLTSSLSHTMLFGWITVNDLRLSPVPREFHATPVIGSPTSRHEIYVTEENHKG